MKRLILLAGMLISCARPPREADPTAAATSRQEVAAAMQNYMVAARAVDANAIAAFFTTTGMLFEPGINPIRSRDSITAFVASFPGVLVDSASVTADTIEVFHGTAFYWGSYFERLAFPGQPVSEQHGKFVIEWVRQQDGAWLIQRYFRVPLPSPR